MAFPFRASLSTSDDSHFGKYEQIHLFDFFDIVPNPKGWLALGKLLFTVSWI